MTKAKTPKYSTLKRYGLTSKEWEAMLESQGGTCGVCRKIPESGRLCTDHEHVKNWKRMPPEERKRYCRGVLCFQCNHQHLRRGMTLIKAEALVEYLRRYEGRKGNE